MTLPEAKEKISRELMEGFHDYLRDWDDLPNDEYGRKYGWGKGTVRPKDTFESLKSYMDLIFGGRWLPGWVKAGYPREVIIELHHEKWLSYQEYSNWRARHTGHTDWYYIPQRTAREIWIRRKDMKED